MTVHERIATALQVIADFDFNKSGKVTGGATYNFIPIGQILQAVRKAHAKAGIFLTMGQLEYDDAHGEGIFVQDRWTKARGHCEVSVNGADGDSISFTVPFNVQDNSDKLDNKIVTNIERQAYRILYAIDEGDATDPEAEWNEDAVSIPTRQAPKTVTKKNTMTEASVPQSTNVNEAARINASKDKLLENISWQFMIQEEIRPIVIDALAEKNVTLDMTPPISKDSIIKILRQTFNVAQLEEIQEAIDRANGKVVA